MGRSCGLRRPQSPQTLCSRESDHDIAARIRNPFGAPDIVVHAAGINTRETADDVTTRVGTQTLALNLAAPFFLTQCCPAMKRQRVGP